MTLSPGTRLGPYEIVAAIGAGGMGEVYRGRDTKLDRDVAIKVCPRPSLAIPSGLPASARSENARLLESSAHRVPRGRDEHHRTH